MIPRYLPALDFQTVAGLWTGLARGGTRATERRFEPDATLWHAYGFDRARDGLTTWLLGLKGPPDGRVIVSAQICPAVRHAIRATGLTPMFIDIDPRYPTPAPAQFAGALSDKTVAVLIAPFYGHIQDDWGPLTGALGSTPLCLDMAQGVLLERRLAALIARSAAVLYSFSVGKGLDIGGAVLFSREMLTSGARPSAARVVRGGAALSSLAVRTLVASGLYRAALPFIERAIEQDHEVSVDTADPTLVDVSAHRQVWADRCAAFGIDVQRARDRARRIGALPAVVSTCRDLDLYMGDAPTHLRQVLRLQRSGRRTAIIETLHRMGVDCAPAGEPLPSVEEPERVFPNATQFTRDAIRLPFLGRLTDAEQLRVEHALEVALG